LKGVVRGKMRAGSSFRPGGFRLEE
jgi:hypothetical protein